MPCGSGWIRIFRRPPRASPACCLRRRLRRRSTACWRRGTGTPSCWRWRLVRKKPRRPSPRRWVRAFFSGAFWNSSPRRPRMHCWRIGKLSASRKNSGDCGGFAIPEKCGDASDGWRNAGIVAQILRTVGQPAVALPWKYWVRCCGRTAIPTGWGCCGRSIVESPSRRTAKTGQTPLITNRREMWLMISKNFTAKFFSHHWTPCPKPTRMRRGWPVPLRRWRGR